MLKMHSLEKYSIPLAEVVELTPNTILCESDSNYGNEDTYEDEFPF